MKSEERKGNFKKENYWYKRVFSLLFFGLLKVNLVNAKFRIFSSQNDDERKFRVVCFLSSFESFSRFSFEECESAFSSYYVLISHSCTKNTTHAYALIIRTAYNNNTT